MVPDHNTGDLAMQNRDPKFNEGMAVRHAMFGAAGAEHRFQRATEFTRPFEEAVTRHLYGELWTQPDLDRATRSLITLAILATQGRTVPLRAHVRGAIANGCKKEEIRATLMQVMAYAGVPAANEAFTAAAEVLREQGLD
jgi:4-carboxymuconolactone decarboxylase